MKKIETSTLLKVFALNLLTTPFFVIWDADFGAGKEMGMFD